MTKNVARLQSTGLLAGLFALFCLPCLLAPLLISVGLSSILVFLGKWFSPVLLGLVGISLIGFFLSFKTHKNPIPLILVLIAGGILYYSRFIVYKPTISYTGAGLLVLAVVIDYFIRRRYKAVCEDCKVIPKKKVL